jgi:hypothetical protein
MRMSMHLACISWMRMSTHLACILYCGESNGNKEVLGVLVTNIFDAGVIHAQIEPVWQACFQRPGMQGCLKYPWCARWSLRSLVEEFVGKDSVLWEAVHSFSDFHFDITINSLFA